MGCPRLRKDIPSAWGFGVCLTVCMVSYTVVMTWSFRSCCVGTTDGVLAQYYRRALLYPLNAILTYGPMAVYLAFYHKDYLPFGVATFCESLNGLVNVLTYAWQSQYFPAISGQTQR